VASNSSQLNLRKVLRENGNFRSYTKIRPRPFAPRAPQRPRPLCSLASSLLRAGPTSPSRSCLLADVQSQSQYVGKVSIVLKKSFLGDERNFLGPLTRSARNDVRGHIVLHKNDHRRSYRRYGAFQRQKRLRINFGESLGVVRFSTFSTLSAASGHWLQAKEGAARDVVKIKARIAAGFLYYQPRYPPPPKLKVTPGPP
jgi:hypothetical protein